MVEKLLHTVKKVRDSQEMYDFNIKIFLNKMKIFFTCKSRQITHSAVLIL